MYLWGCVHSLLWGCLKHLSRIDVFFFAWCVARFRAELQCVFYLCSCDLIWTQPTLGLSYDRSPIRVWFCMVGAVFGGVCAPSHSLCACPDESFLFTILPPPSHSLCAHTSKSFLFTVLLTPVFIHPACYINKAFLFTSCPAVIYLLGPEGRRQLRKASENVGWTIHGAGR